MKNDYGVYKRARVPNGARAQVVEERRGLIGDHVIDGEARRYAIFLRLGLDYTSEGVDHGTERDMTRLR